MIVAFSLLLVVVQMEERASCEKLGLLNDMLILSSVSVSRFLSAISFV